MDTIYATITQPTIEASFGTLLRSNLWESVALQTLAADSTIAVSTAVISVVPIVSAGGAITLTSTPTLQTSGVSTWHLAIVIGTSDTDMPTIQDESNLPSSGLHLSNKRNMTFGKNDTCLFLFNGTVWIPLGREDSY